VVGKVYLPCFFRTCVKAVVSIPLGVSGIRKDQAHLVILLNGIKKGVWQYKKRCTNLFSKKQFARC